MAPPAAERKTPDSKSSGKNKHRFPPEGARGSASLPLVPRSLHTPELSPLRIAPEEGEEPPRSRQPLRGACAVSRAGSPRSAAASSWRSPATRRCRTTARSCWSTRRSTGASRSDSITNELPSSQLPSQADISRVSPPPSDGLLESLQPPQIGEGEHMPCGVALREQLKELKQLKQYEKSENDLKALQSVGQIVGEVLKQLTEEKFIVKATNGPRYVVGCRRQVRIDQSTGFIYHFSALMCHLDKSKLKPGTRVALDMTTLTIMR
ncbi:hypothetical protein lerEdw1_020174 [Lerista edwardsae]|nr:hypothetical protein lerEdw1_020174 [Lerista edwardsae]